MGKQRKNGQMLRLNTAQRRDSTVQNVAIFNPVEKFGGAFLATDEFSFLITGGVGLNFSSFVEWSLMRNRDSLAVLLSTASALDFTYALV
jgi:hypothetical protein